MAELCRGRVSSISCRSVCDPPDLGHPFYLIFTKRHDYVDPLVGDMRLLSLHFPKTMIPRHPWVFITHQTEIEERQKSKLCHRPSSKRHQRAANNLYNPA